MENTGIQKAFQLFDERDQVWFDHYTAPGLEGTTISADVPREEHTVAAVRKYMMRAGALASAIQDDKAVADAIAVEAPIVHRAAAPGWRNGNRVFVSHRHVAGLADKGSVQPPVSPLYRPDRVLSAGDLDGWKKLAGISRHSTAMTVSLCAAFAAPLLRLVGRPSFALILVGATRAGKSTAKLLGASVYGFGDETELPCLDATHAGLLAAAVASNDHMLPINEVGTARGEKRDIYLVLREATYGLVNGQDTMRHPTWKGNGTGMPSSFQVICLMSSEHAPDEWAARRGETREEGEMARLIGVPAVAPGKQKVFDNLPKSVAGEDIDAWVTDQFRSLRDGLKQHRGVAMRDYLDFLVKDVDENTARANELIAQFESEVATPEMSPVARDIVAKFGVLYAGGVLAAEADVLPRQAKFIWNDMQDACEGALALLPDPAAELRADLRALKNHLEGAALIDLENCTGKQRRLIRNADGYYEGKANGRRYVVRAQQFTGWFPSGLRARRILEHLDDEGLLEHGRARTQGRSNEWAQTQVTWPDETRQRSICFFFPEGLDDLERLA